MSASKFKKYNVETKLNVSKYPEITIITKVTYGVFKSFRYITVNLKDHRIVGRNLDIHFVYGSVGIPGIEELFDPLLINIEDIISIIPGTIELEACLEDKSAKVPERYALELILFTLTSLLFAHFYDIKLKKKPVLFFRYFSVSNIFIVSNENLEENFYYSVKIKKDYICVRRLWSK